MTLINRIMQSKWVPRFVRWRYWQTRDLDCPPLTEAQLAKMVRVDRSRRQEEIKDRITGKKKMIAFRRMCEKCGKYPAEYPSKLCPGCEQAHRQ